MHKDVEIMSCTGRYERHFMNWRPEMKLKDVCAGKRQNIIICGEITRNSTSTNSRKDQSAIHNPVHGEAQCQQNSLPLHQQAAELLHNTEEASGPGNISCSHSWSIHRWILKVTHNVRKSYKKWAFRLLNIFKSSHVTFMV